MNILHTISSLGINSGGPALSTFLTVKGLHGVGIGAEILSYEKSSEQDKLIAEEDFVHLIPPSTNSFAYSKTYKKFLLENRKYDLYHIQGVWQYPGYITARVARKYNNPYIITPRGMLYPQDIAKGKFKKDIFLKLFLLKDLNEAACIHATCMEELRHLRNLGIKIPIAVIPNPIDTSVAKENIELKPKMRVGYLGRVHPRKNIERTIYAWKLLENDTKNGELVIIGDGDKKYLDFLRQECERLDLKNVVFTGFLSGIEKEKALTSLYYLVVPSDFENFGMIIPEALLQGVPVIASKGTPWEELDKHYCGWWVNNDVETLTATLEKAFAVSEEVRVQMGLRGKELIKSNYSIEMVALKMEQLYKWILNGGEKPEFVYLTK